MSRRKIIKEAEEVVEDAQVVMRWSTKRIVIATFLVVMIIAGGLYAISLLSQNPRVLGQNTNNNRPKIKIPDERKIERIIDGAQEELSNINAKNIVESQPRLKKIIDDLTNLTSSSNSAKDLICDSLCK